MSQQRLRLSRAVVVRFECGSWRAIANEHGWTEQAVSEWGRHFGIRRHTHLTGNERARIQADLLDRARRGALPSPAELVEEVGRISEKTAERWLTQARKAAREAG